MDNFTIPPYDNKRDYYCQTFNISQMISKMTNKPEKTLYHAIEFDPFIGNKDAVHLMIMYKCDNLDLLKDKEYCGNILNYCKPIVIYGEGTAPFILPKEAGMIWGSNDTNFAALSVHYKGQNSAVNKMDNSGFRVYFTPNLRPNNAGNMVIGKLHNQLKIAPNMTSITINDTCSMGCTRKNISPDGINIFATLLHGHQYLKQIRSDIIYANGTVDNTTLRDDNFKFNHQMFTYWKQPIKIHPGDSFKTFCTYDTEGISNYTIGGYHTEKFGNEMCYVLLAFYPRENGLSYCFEEPEICLK